MTDTDSALTAFAVKMAACLVVFVLAALGCKWRIAQIQRLYGEPAPQANWWQVLRHYAAMPTTKPRPVRDDWTRLRQYRQATYALLNELRRLDPDNAVACAVENRLIRPGERGDE